MPPPPVSGATVGGGGTACWDAGGLPVADEVRAEWLGVAAGEEVPGELGARLAEAETEAETEAEAEAPAVVVDRPDAGLLVLARALAVEVWPPAGDGVRVTAFVADPGDDVSGVGVNVDGTEEPPAVQAETATVSRAAPAASRPAASHASRVAAGVLGHIFMDPPGTRPLHPLIRRARPGDEELSLRSGCLPDKELPHNRAPITNQAAKG